MLLGYNTNGMAHHRLEDALRLLADEGFQSVALTLEVGALDPQGSPTALHSNVARAREWLDELSLRRVVETGARYLLNPRKKHDPTLLDPDPTRRLVRIEFLKRAIDIAADLGAEAVSFWSGVLPDLVSFDVALARLVESLQPVLEHAERREMTLAFEPEPGMFIDTFERFLRLDERIHHRLFHLTVDLGHVHCIESGPVGDHVRRWGERIRNIHIEDMNRGVHEHLMFGEGTMDFAEIFDALRAIGYARGLHVELSRHSHMAVEAVRASSRFLRPLM